MSGCLLDTTQAYVYIDGMHGWGVDWCDIDIYRLLAMLHENDSLGFSSSIDCYTRGYTGDYVKELIAMLTKIQYNHHDTQDSFAN